MGHYYAFCEVHKKCGPERPDTDSDAEAQAWEDCTVHLETESPPHGKVFVKYSTRRVSSTGNTYRYYQMIAEPS